MIRFKKIWKNIYTTTFKSCPLLLHCFHVILLEEFRSCPPLPIEVFLFSDLFLLLFYFPLPPQFCLKFDEINKRELVNSVTRVQNKYFLYLQFINNKSRCHSIIANCPTSEIVRNLRFSMDIPLGIISLFSSHCCVPCPKLRLFAVRGLTSPIIKAQQQFVHLYQ